MWRSRADKSHRIIRFPIPSCPVSTIPCEGDGAAPFQSSNWIRRKYLVGGKTVIGCGIFATTILLIVLRPMPLTCSMSKNMIPIKFGVLSREKNSLLPGSTVVIKGLSWGRSLDLSCAKMNSIMLVVRRFVIRWRRIQYNCLGSVLNFVQMLSQYAHVTSDPVVRVVSKI